MDKKFRILETAIRMGDISAGVEEAERLANEGVSPLIIFRDCVEPCLRDIGDRFSRLEIFLPEMVEASEVVKEIQEVLKPYLENEDQTLTSKGRVVICTTQGDLHDIGKNIVRAMLEVNGFEVKDLGVNVAPIEALRAAKEFNADIIAVSALMMPSLPYVKDTIQIVKQNDEYQKRFKLLVGGGPLTRDWAKMADADGYGDDAIEAVKEATILMA